jgi:hypothetical protein
MVDTPSVKSAAADLTNDPLKMVEAVAESLNDPPFVKTAAADFMNDALFIKSAAADLMNDPSFVKSAVADGLFSCAAANPQPRTTSSSVQRQIRNRGKPFSDARRQIRNRGKRVEGVSNCFYGRIV